ncbi:MAG: hypothetical protein R3F21_24700 [Myxococcota bacterium]
MAFGTRDSSMLRRRWAAFVLLLGVIGLPMLGPVGIARAQGRGTRALRSVSVDGSEAGWIIEVQFEFPIRYLRHTPQRPGRMLHIEVDPLDLGGDEALEDLERESLPIQTTRSGPLAGIFFEGTATNQAVVELQFSRTLAFVVTPGADQRSLRIEAALPAAAVAPAPPVADSAGSAAESDAEGAARAAGAAVAPSRAQALLVRARHAVRDGDLDLAIALLTRVLELPESEASIEARMDARELVGVTHERRGQMAHAAAEYEAYLAEHPDGPAATRVRQRLEAIRSASAPPSAALRSSSRPALGGDGVRKEVFGSLAARYFRNEVRVDGGETQFSASDVLADVDLAGRLDAETWSIRGDFRGTYDFDLGDEGRSDDLRITRMAVRGEDRSRGLEASLGRQRRTNGGVLGRFDGLYAAARVHPSWKLSVLTGLPVEGYSDAVPNAETWLFGGAVDFENLPLAGLQGQVFAIGQRAYSMTDRTAIGGELRYATDRTYSFTYLDYDVVFASLNTFLASSTWRATDSTDLRVLLERRNTPALTLATALQGQFVEDLDELKKTYSESELRDLARDRTAAMWIGTLGATHRPIERLQVSADLTVSHLSGTDSSAGVIGSEASGPDVGGTLQLLLSDWLVENGVGSVSVRYYEGDAYRSFMAMAYSRFNLLGSMRILPRLRWQWQDSVLDDSRSILQPSFEVDWRHSAWLLNCEIGAQWEEPISGNGAVQEIGYFIEAGVRWQF